MPPMLGEAKREALRNIKPPKDNLVWQFALQDELGQFGEKLEKLRSLPQDMGDLKQRFSAIRAMQEKTWSGMQKNEKTSSGLQAENTALAEELEKLTKKVDDLAQMIETRILNKMVKTKNDISILSKENEALKQRLDEVEPLLRTCLANQQSVSGSSKRQKSSSTQQPTGSQSGQIADQSKLSRNRPVIRSNPSVHTPMQQSNRIHKELQENRNAIRSDESRSGHKSPADRETPQSLPKADLSEEVSIYVPTTRTNIIRESRSLISRNPSGKVASSSKAPDVSAAASMSFSGSTSRPRDSASMQKPVLPPCSQGNKSLIQYFTERSRLIRPMSPNTDSLFAKDWINGLADKELYKGLNYITMKMAQHRGSENIGWEDIDNAIWLPILKGGMYWAEKEERVKESIKAQEILARKANDEASALPAKRARH